MVEAQVTMSGVATMLAVVQKTQEVRMWVGCCCRFQRLAYRSVSVCLVRPSW
jgi:hypothetical protein